MFIRDRRSRPLTKCSFLKFKGNKVFIDFILSDADIAKRNALRCVAKHFHDMAYILCGLVKESSLASFSSSEYLKRYSALGLLAEMPLTQRVARLAGVVCFSVVGICGIETSRCGRDVALLI